MLQEQEIIDDTLIQRRFGSSLDVIDILERIEAVRSYQLWKKDESATRATWDEPEWPIWNLYAKYKREPEQENIPAYRDAFEQWRAGFEQRDPGEAS